MQVGVLGHRLPEVLARVVGVVARAAPRIDGAKHVVLQVRLVAQHLAEVVVDRRREGVQPRSQLGRVVGSLARVLRVDAEVAQVEPPDGAALLAEGVPSRRN